MSVHESGEMYLEAILVLSKKNGIVRSIDVSEYLGYSKPSVSRAVGILKNGGYIQMDKDGSLTLTETGRTTADQAGCFRGNGHRRCLQNGACHFRRIL